MSYTLISCKDYQSEQTIDIVKSGNHYNLEFTDSNTFYRYGSYDLKEIQEKYLIIIECFINGLYSFEQRLKILKGGLKHEKNIF